MSSSNFGSAFLQDFLSPDVSWGGTGEGFAPCAALHPHRSHSQGPLCCGPLVLWCRRHLAVRHGGAGGGVMEKKKRKSKDSPRWQRWCGEKEKFTGEKLKAGYENQELWGGVRCCMLKEERATGAGTIRGQWSNINNIIEWERKNRRFFFFFPNVYAKCIFFTQHSAVPVQGCMGVVKNQWEVFVTSFLR